MIDFKHFSLKKFRSIEYLLFIIGLFFFAWSQFNTLINPDGYLYFATALTFLDHGFRSAFDFYNWPFYSILLAYLHQFLLLSLEHAALLLKFLFYILIIYSFIRLIKRLDGQKTEQLVGVLLLITLPLFNEVLRYVVRDYGYLAFLLLGLNQLITYSQNPKLKYSLYWLLCITLATLFRIEALIIMPLASIFLFKPSRILYFNMPFLALIALLTLVFLFNPWSTSGIQLSRVGYFLDWFMLLIKDNYPLFSNNTQKIASLLSEHLRVKETRLVLISGFTFLLFAKIITGVTFLNSIGLYFYSKQMSSYFSNPRWRILFGVIFIQLCVTVVFTFTHFFMIQRYLAGIIITLLIPASFGIVYAFKQIQQRQIIFYLLLFAFLYNVVDTLVSFGTSKAYIKEASYFARSHLSSNDRILTNFTPIAYYIDQFSPEHYLRIQSHYSLIDNQTLKQEINQNAYDAAILHIDRHNLSLMNLLDNDDAFTLKAEFFNKKGDRVLIYTMNKDDHKASHN